MSTEGMIIAEVLISSSSILNLVIFPYYTNLLLRRKRWT
jgi:hypothetical protein